MFPTGGSLVKNLQMLCSRCLHGPLSCLLRLFGRAPLISCVFLFNRAEKRVMNAYHITVFLCPVLLRRFYCSLRQRTFNYLRLIRILRVCRARCHCGGLTRHRSSSRSLFSASSPSCFSSLHNQLLGILLAKTAFSHLSQSHFALSPILLAVVFTSACNVLIIDDVTFTPLVARIGADGACRYTIVMQLP